MAYVALANGDTNATYRAKINTAFTTIDALDGSKAVIDATKVVVDAIKVAADLTKTATQRTTAKKTVSSMTTQNLFTVSGGAVKIVSIVGHITTAIQASTNATKLVYTSTGGAAVDLCATLDVTGSAIRKLLTFVGVKATAMTLSADEGVVVNAVATVPIIVTPGILSLNCGATTTGVVDWYITYEPMAIGATIT